MQPFVVVLFGATGDLSRRKLLPGLMRLHQAGLLPECRIIGTSLEEMDREGFEQVAREACEEFVYPGEGHLFGFEGWHEYDEVASHDMYERVSEFLSEVDG